MNAEAYLDKFLTHEWKFFVGRDADGDVVFSYWELTPRGTRSNCAHSDVATNGPRVSQEPTGTAGRLCSSG